MASGGASSPRHEGAGSAGRKPPASGAGGFLGSADCPGQESAGLCGGLLFRVRGLLWGCRVFLGLCVVVGLLGTCLFGYRPLGAVVSLHV